VCLRVCVYVCVCGCVGALTFAFRTLDPCFITCFIAALVAPSDWGLHNRKQWRTVLDVLELKFKKYSSIMLIQLSDVFTLFTKRWFPS
jgi:hypothetical protein